MNTEHPRIGTIETVYVDGNTITGKVYNVRDNGWACVETESGRCASGPGFVVGQRVEIHPATPELAAGASAFTAGDRVCSTTDAGRFGTVRRITDFGIHVAWDGGSPANALGHVYREGEWVDVCDASEVTITRKGDKS